MGSVESFAAGRAAGEATAELQPGNSKAAGHMSPDLDRPLSLHRRMRSVESFLSPQRFQTAQLKSRSGRREDSLTGGFSSLDSPSSDAFSPDNRVPVHGDDGGEASGGRGAVSPLRMARSPLRNATSPFRSVANFFGKGQPLPAVSSSPVVPGRRNLHSPTQSWDSGETEGRLGVQAGDGEDGLKGGGAEADSVTPSSSTITEGGVDKTSAGLGSNVIVRDGRRSVGNERKEGEGLGGRTNSQIPGPKSEGIVRTTSQENEGRLEPSGDCGKQATMPARASAAAAAGAQPRRLHHSRSSRSADGTLRKAPTIGSDPHFGRAMSQGESSTWGSVFTQKGREERAEGMHDGRDEDKGDSGFGGDEAVPVLLRRLSSRGSDCSDRDGEVVPAGKRLMYEKVRELSKFKARDLPGGLQDARQKHEDIKALYRQHKTGVGKGELGEGGGSPAASSSRSSSSGGSGRLQLKAAPGASAGMIPSAFLPPMSPRYGGAAAGGGLKGRSDQGEEGGLTRTRGGFGSFQLFKEGSVGGDGPGAQRDGGRIASAAAATTTTTTAAAAAAAAAASGDPAQTSREGIRSRSPLAWIASAVGVGGGGTAGVEAGATETPADAARRELAAAAAAARQQSSMEPAVMTAEAGARSEWFSGFFGATGHWPGADASPMSDLLASPTSETSEDVNPCPRVVTAPPSLSGDGRKGMLRVGSQGMMSPAGASAVLKSPRGKLQASFSFATQGVEEGARKGTSQASMEAKKKLMQQLLKK